MIKWFAAPTSIVWLTFVALAGAANPIPRVLPPRGIELSAEQQQRISLRLREVLGHAQSHLEDPNFADVAVLIKAVDFALRDGEFYQAKDPDKALRLLKLADERIELLAAKNSNWTKQKGRVVRGFRSRIDDSFQPYGLVIPDDVDLDRPVPLYVWLHGRGDNQTDLHFIHGRLDQDGQIKPPGAIVLHPFGRQCLGYKSAGETDVMESIEHVQAHYKIDPERIVLIGFSMGGAGAWHLGAHYTDRFVAISPGAGFAETARYTNLKPENYPPRYEQALWSVYDVPNYTRNLFNRPVIAYSGELDKQIQSARVMEEAFRQHGRELPHLIGPGVEHKYHPDTLKELLQKLHEIVVQGRPQSPDRVSLQTQTLRYHKMDWVEMLGLNKHWQDSRIDAEVVGERKLKVSTKNVTSFQLSRWPQMGNTEIEVDGKLVAVPSDVRGAVILQRGTKWEVNSGGKQALAKQHGRQGPIDDAFLDPFLVVLPSGKDSDVVQQWVQFELDHFRNRWREVFRGELRIRSDTNVTPEDIARYHLVVWGTPASNQVLKRVYTEHPFAPPLSWSGEDVQAGQERFSAKTHVPIFIYPNPLNVNRYLVVNSGPTFREAHDRTNSLQNPKLPDWAVIDITQPPDAKAPGRIVAADFFDENWRMR